MSGGFMTSVASVGITLDILGDGGDDNMMERVAE